MSKKTLRIIIGLMSVAMIGLIIFQTYWINDAIKANDIQFKQQVHDALNNVVLKLEKKEVYNAAAQQLKNPYLNRRTFMVDSNFLSSSSQIRTSQEQVTMNMSTGQSQSFGWVSDMVVSDSFYLGNQMIRISYEFSGMNAPDFNSAIKEERTQTQNQVNSNPNIFAQNENDLRENIQRFTEKSHMVTVVLDELLRERKQISRRIRKDELENLINDQLIESGIDINYEYAVVDRAMNRSLFSNYETQDEQNVLLSNFSAKLFPNDINSGQNYLTIFFPDQSGYLFKQIWLSLTSSVFLALLIIFCFAYAIFALLQQKKVSEIKNDFVNNMTHEFKTPISTVSLACEALQDREIQKNENFINKYIEVIRDENKRLGRQVENVLQMATLDKKDFKLKFEELDIHEIIDKVISNLKFQIQKNGGEIEKRLIASNNRIISDEVHLTNIIYNLLDNANKYSKDIAEITIETEDHHQGLLIRISDKGIGMSREAIEKIFDKFYRVPTGNIHDIKGFGLGLAYVKTMLVALNGQIKVKSVLSKGSTFEIILPLKYG